MPGRNISKIKWNKRDQRETTRIIRNFNAKITRLESQGKSFGIPEKIGIKEFKSDIYSRADLNRELNRLKRFSKRGVEELIESKTGNLITKWERQEIGRQVQIINAKRTRERKRIENTEATSRGQKLGMKRGEMEDDRLSDVRKKQFNFNKIRPGREWELFKQAVNEQVSSNFENSKNESYKRNYIASLYSAGLPNANKISAIVSQIPADKVVQIYYSEEQASIDFVYDPMEALMKSELIMEIWQNVLDG